MNSTGRPRGRPDPTPSISAREFGGCHSRAKSERLTAATNYVASGLRVAELAMAEKTNCSTLEKALAQLNRVTRSCTRCANSCRSTEHESTTNRVEIGVPHRGPDCAKMHSTFRSETGESARCAPHRLRKLAGWYREFAERTGNPRIWEARLHTAEDLEAEADRLERASNGRDRPRSKSRSTVMSDPLDRNFGR